MVSSTLDIPSWPLLEKVARALSRSGAFSDCAFISGGYARTRIVPAFGPRAKRDLLRQDFDRRVVRDQQPDLQHVGVGDGDAAVGPVAAGVVGGRVFQLVRQAVDHDR